MKTKYALFMLSMVFVLTPSQAGSVSIDDFTTIPSLNKVVKREGVLSLRDEIKVYYSGVKKSAILEQTLKDGVFSAFTVSEAKDTKGASIVFEKKAGIPTEGYEIDVTTDQIRIYAGDDAGFLYALQSLRQIIGGHQSKNLQIQCIDIEDSPRVKFRSFMLDSGRQYHKMETVKKYIDMISILKMNYFHWHLTESLGWRVAIEKYPLLTEKGAHYAKATEQQGFYTKEDMKEIVRYAAERSITVIPEIGMPGHAEAAIFAYPELSCTGKRLEVAPTRLTDLTLCVGKDHTMTFLKDVLTEVCEIFPSEYIHIGGDEAHKANWNKCPDCIAKRAEVGVRNSHQLQLWFTTEIANHLGKKGRKVICWGDVVHQLGYDLPDNIVVQWWNWRGHKDTAYNNARKAGLEVICGTNYYNYLNFPTTPWTQYGKARTFDMKDIYTKNPSYYIPKNRPYDKVIGMNAALWTDGNVTESMIDRRVFPRIFAIAEQMWYKETLKDFDTFMKGVKDKQSWFESLGYKYGPALKETTPNDYKWD